MSHTKIANKLQNLKSSAIRELLKHSKMDGVISLAEEYQIQTCLIGKAYRLLWITS